MISINKDTSTDIILDLHSVSTIVNPYYVFKFIDANKWYTITTNIKDISPTPTRYSQFTLDNSVLLALHTGEAEYFVYEASTFTTDPSLLTLIWSDTYRCTSNKTYVNEVYYQGVDPSNNYDAPEYMYGDDITYTGVNKIIIK